MKKQIFLTVVILVFVGAVSAASVGAVPGSLTFENAEPGNQVKGTIYITTNYQANFNVSPSSTTQVSDELFRIDEANRISEQGSSEWFEFETSEINPSGRRQVTLDDGSIATVQGSFDYNLNIPDGAEPGIHFGRITLNSGINSAQGGAGTINFAETRVPYRIDVSGQSRRDIVVQDIRGFRTDTESASVELLLSNTGTVTTTTDNFEIDVLDSTGRSVETLRASGVELEPGESEWTNANWDGENVDEGTYQIDGEVDYFTGSAYASGSFSLGDIVTVEQAPDDSPVSDSQDSRETVPMWLVFMVLAIMAVLMWSFDIEPFWILAIVGGLAISAFILLSGVSNYLLVVLLMAVGIVVYGVM